MPEVKIDVVTIDIPEGTNVIVGQSHFIKTVEDMYETLASSSPSLKFGFAFCEASGKRLIRYDGNDQDLVKIAIENAKKIGSGHSFVLYLKNGFPINVLNRIKSLDEVITIFAATANPLQVIVAETNQGRGILGVVDGFSPLGVEGDEDIKERKELLRKFGYKK
ncbi:MULTISPECIES: adenosine-specific kinase [Acidianus]|uniref:Adenosine monophosphate-protein transferase n=1 Tax=Candidatus Acidianus copahuensis TaxID=1160895 RepID=A0A031LLD0_9CREN|nr:MULTISPECIES: adenosine-specific kinase [Acidianus]EZQ04862.1 adenosine monophosphate-protein transferase [Candidatus Acidianus copahuensis]NON63176.1 adenosine monophosphate-protein transferase [Acidianus sp. RZ1]